MSMAASTTFLPPPHTRIHHHHHQQQHAPPSLYHSHEPLPTSPETPNPLYIHTSHHHNQQHQHQQQSYPSQGYHAPSPPYTSHNRASSTEPVQKPILPYPTTHHHDQKRLYTSSSTYRSHPYSPPILPPMTVGRAPLSPRSPNDAPPHYPLPERHSFKADLPLSPSPPPSSTSSSVSYATTNAPGTESGETGPSSLSTQDRRERNKAASAKYRAKKHHQSGEMRQQITLLQDQNNVLTRQLEESRTENASLKNMIEKLRGRLVAEKVLRRLREVGREKRRSSSGTSKVSVLDLASGSEDEDDDDIGIIEGDDGMTEDPTEEDDEELHHQGPHRPEKRSKSNPRRRSN